MSLEDFRQQFEYLIGYEPPPLLIDAGGEAGLQENERRQVKRNGVTETEF
jgi:hypothetical protein